MNMQVLQVLIFCIPFYDFLDRVGQRAAHKFKSDTPLVDAMYVPFRTPSFGIESGSNLPQDHVYERVPCDRCRRLRRTASLAIETERA
jgi:hypothetical protein